MTRTRRRDGGFALVVLLMVMLLIAVFMSGIVEVWRLQRSLITRDVDIIKADEAARAGISQAIYDIGSSSTWTTGYSNVALSSATTTFSMSFTPASTPYSVNNGAGASSVTGYAGRTVPAGCAQLVSIGQSGAVRVAEEAIVSVGGTSLPRFDYALTSVGAISLSADAFDSFDSASGVPPASYGTAANLRTNATADRSVLIKKGTVQGTITVGPGGSATTVKVSAGASYSGPPIVAASPYSFMAVTAPTGASLGNQNLVANTTLAPGNYDTVTLNGYTLTLTAGTYRFINIVDLTGSTITFNTSGGRVVVYITGTSLDLSRTTLVNASYLAANALIMATSACLNLTVKAAGTQTCVGVWAPSANVTLTGIAPFYGALAGATTTTDSATSSTVHYDLALQRISASGSVTVLSRQRLNF